MQYYNNYIPLCYGILFRVTRPFFLPPLPFRPSTLDSTDCVNTISTVYEALWLHYIMQQETLQVLLDPPLPSAFPSLNFHGREEGLAARLGRRLAWPRPFL